VEVGESTRMETARKAGIEVIYQGVDITEDISKRLIGFTMNDNAAYTADDASLILEDRDLVWLRSWWPERGDRLKIRLKTENWMKDGTQILDLGTFLLDTPSYSGPPHQITLSAISTPDDSNFSDTARDKAWEKSDVQAIAQEIAGKYNLNLLFDSQINPIVDRLDQNKTSDMNFLSELCKKYGLAFKVTSDSIVIFDFSSYENKMPVVKIDRTGGQVKQFSIQTAVGYTACRIVRSDSDHKKITSVVQDPSKAGGKEKILEAAEMVTNQTEAELIAKARLREANKEEIRISLSIIGNLKIVAGMTIQLSNFGKFDGNYFIEKASYSLLPFSMTLELYRVMGW